MGLILAAFALRARLSFIAALTAVMCFALQGQNPVLAQAPAVEVGPLAVPAAAEVALDAGTTSFVVIDLLASTCAPNPACAATLPAVADGLAAARTAQARVVYSVHPAPDNAILPDVAPMPDDPIFVAVPGDKFFNSDLDDTLKQAGTTTLVLSGFSSNSGVMYTAAAATQRGYTVVVVEDGIAGASDLATSVALWQMLHGPGANPQNNPLQPRAVTLSRTNLISYK